MPSVMSAILIMLPQYTMPVAAAAMLAKVVRALAVILSRRVLDFGDAGRPGLAGSAPMSPRGR